jgi:hypothetical protein
VNDNLLLLADRLAKLTERVGTLEAIDYRLRSVLQTSTTVPSGTTLILEYVEVANGYQLSISDNAALILVG